MWTYRKLKGRKKSYVQQQAPMKLTQGKYALPTPFNSRVQSTKATAKSRWITLITATKKTPNKIHQNYSVPTMYRPALGRLLLPFTHDDPKRWAQGSAAHVFMLSTSGDELEHSFGIWRWKNEYWSILVDQLLTTTFVPRVFPLYSVWQLHTQPLIVAAHHHLRVAVSIYWWNLERDISGILRSEVSTK